MIRGEMGLVVGALSKKLNLPLGPTEVEAKAFEEGTLFARDIGIHQIILEGDSLVVSNAIAGRTSSPSSIASVVYGIISLFHFFRSFEVFHIFRNDNCSIHLLAKYA